MPQKGGYGSSVVSISAIFVAEIPLRSPQKIFIFIIKNIYLLDQSIQKINELILKKETLVSIWAELYRVVTLGAVECMSGQCSFLSTY